MINHEMIQTVSVAQFIKKLCFVDFFSTLVVFRAQKEETMVINRAYKTF